MYCFILFFKQKLETKNHLTIDNTIYKTPETYLFLKNMF